MTDQLKINAFNERTLVLSNGCIKWIGPRHDKGYGRFTFKRKQELAHRAAWEIFKGALPADACVLHRCDNPPCVNPEHLFLGDRGDNARDMSSKGRQWVQKNPKGRPVCPPEMKARGITHGMSKLIDQDVIAIRRRAAQGELGKTLAKEFCLSTSSISQILLGKIWIHVGGPFKPSRNKASK